MNNPEILWYENGQIGCQSYYINGQKSFKCDFIKN